LFKTFLLGIDSVEFLVITVAAIVGWVFNGQFNKINLSTDRLFDQFIESGFLSKGSWRSLIFLVVSWLLVLLIMWVTKQLIFQNSPPLSFLLEALMLALMFNIFDVRAVSSIVEATGSARQQDLSDGVTTLLSVTASRISSLMLWYWITPGLSGAIFFFIILSMFKALVRSNLLVDFASNQLVVRGYSVLVWLPHKILILTYAFVGDFETALRCWRAQGRQSGLGLWSDLLATSGGALNVQLGGVASVGTGKIYKPVFGLPGNVIAKETIPRAIAFFIRSLLLWVVVFFLSDVFFSR
jgi:cobalamin biosynthesis protein CobD/CbiB